MKGQNETQKHNNSDELYKLRNRIRLKFKTEHAKLRETGKQRN